MKHTIIAIIAGWIILSMILIIFLLVRTRSMERKLDELWQMQRVMNQQVPDTEQHYPGKRPAAWIRRQWL
ncbi:MAG: hypothetical protein ACLR78_14635 [Roseburia sp.]